MKLLNSKTYLNLAKAYAGETQARTRYEFIEYGARMQGLKALADLIQKVTMNEFNHARMLYSFIQTADTGIIANIDIASGYPFKEKWNLLDNLKLAAEDETEEEKRIYPEYGKIAKQEGFDDIEGLFDNLVQVESCHRKLFTQLYEQMRDGTMYKKPKSVKWKCGDCGFEHEGKEAFAECPLCHAKQGVFLLKINDE
ncbi:MAG: rubrerythrin family protein [Clostridiaceae bacterium]|nr:rubrerythrin family protein [Clostridiaceae bacterium]